MGERQYLAVRTVGRPEEILHKVKHSIQRLKLARSVPIIKIEKMASREFYIFLAIEDCEGDFLPKQIKDAIQIAGVRGEKLWPISINQIKKMTASMEIDTHSFHSLKYSSLWQNEDFSFEDIESLESGILCNDQFGKPELGDLYNRLLYWLTWVGEGAWPAFVKTCLTLGLVDEPKKARSVFRKLRLLGHVESSNDGSRWKVCPSTLVLSPGSDYLFLCGQRTPHLEDFISRNYAVAYINQPLYEGPTSIRITLNKLGIDQQSQLYNHFIWAGSTSILLADLLPDLAGWKELMPAVDRLNIHNYLLEKWENGNYQPCEDFSYTKGEYKGKSGLYQLTQKDSKHQHSLNLYFDYPKQRWIKGDWYGLRFLTVNDSTRILKVYYDHDKEILAIMLNQCWPMVYEKALVLASGLLPVIRRPKNLMHYREIPSELLSLLATKLKVYPEVKEIV